ncbi:hypothetical protein HanIR_Chr09g0411171 [Helianthus annuus]|nr:hypothetical protein HanIR_Chr09g0411171 [Helianthus annuus]
MKRTSREKTFRSKVKKKTPLAEDRFLNSPYKDIFIFQSLRGQHHSFQVPSRAHLYFLIL